MPGNTQGLTLVLGKLTISGTLDLTRVAANVVTCRVSDLSSTLFLWLQEIESLELKITVSKV